MQNGLLYSEVGVEQQTHSWGEMVIVVLLVNNECSNSFPARNLPPFCFKVPKLKGLLSLCFRFYDIKWKHSVGACVKFGFKLLFVIHEDVKVGCFNFKNLEKEAQQALGLIFYELAKISGHAQALRPDFVLVAFIAYISIALSSLF